MGSPRLRGNTPQIRSEAREEKRGKKKRGKEKRGKEKRREKFNNSFPVSCWNYGCWIIPKLPLAKRTIW